MKQKMSTFHGATEHANGKMQQDLFCLTKTLRPLTASQKLAKEHYLHGHGGVTVESLPLHGQRGTDVLLLREPLQHTVAQCRGWRRGEPANPIA
jgi:hypothetical protein